MNTQYLALAKGTPNILEPGIYFDMPRDQYDAIPAFNQSLLKKWIEMQSIPAEFKVWFDERHADREISDAFRIGQALDCALLDPVKFEQEFVVVPQDAPKKPTSAQRNAKKPSPDSVSAICWWDEWNAKTADKTVLDFHEYNSVRRMRQELLECPDTADVFAQCRKAVIVSEIEGFPVKAEFDLWNPKTEHILDLKTAESVQPRDFARNAIKFGYDKQVAWYLELAKSVGVEKSVFDFVCVRSSAPYTVAVHSVMPEIVQPHRNLVINARAKLISALYEVAHRLKSDEWQGFSHYSPLEFPRWATRENGDDFNL